MASEKSSHHMELNSDSQELREVLSKFVRYVPALGSPQFRSLLGLSFLVLIFAINIDFASTFAWLTLASFSIFAWYTSSSLTQKYVHKYPYRYYSYLVASHFKAALIVTVLVLIGVVLSDFINSNAILLIQVLGSAAIFDLLIGIPRKRKELAEAFDAAKLTSREMSAQAESNQSNSDSSIKGHTDRSESVFMNIKHQLTAELEDFASASIDQLLDSTRAAIVQAKANSSDNKDGIVQVLFCPDLLNDVRRMNKFLIREGAHVEMGGYLVGRYQSLEFKRELIEKRFGERLFWPLFLLNFSWNRVLPKIPILNKVYFAITRGKGRHVSKAEVWGRLSFCGFRVMKERDGSDSTFFVAVRVATPVTNKRPSYYPVIGLEKLGMDGKNVKIHKMRSMYPFSEFLQKQIFEEHGLATTGKFKNDFRLTEYGKHIRRYWLDEIPQFYDWLRGDIKIVGIRATSAHFLSLYPPSFMDFYVKVKPGLISPIFDENTQGLDKIIQVELDYLVRYMKAPFRTDLKTLLDTLKDIVFRGVRSK